ncbi:calpain-like cysteine peptidase [Strigomonas culicis]|nr:calpain-like cysteine peptidase [Strigomonas culicis]|eukprot:EPY30171.1 calpain-like cysteine peptidase [Strigomonas culicis]
MEWKDVVQYFDGGGVCMVKKKWYDYRFPGKFVDLYPSFSLKVEVTKKQRFFFTLSQRDRRTLDADDPEALYKGFLIAVCGTDPASQQQEVTAISSLNPESHAADVFTFTVRRDVSIEVELDPKNSPYYIVPRIMVANRDGPKDFTLAMLTPNKASAKSPAVSFVRLPDSCPLFKNSKTFKVEEEKSVDLQFQCKTRGSVPRLRDGASVHDSRKAEEVYPFPVKTGVCC